MTEVPLYAPTDMDLINVTDDGDDYGMIFKASCEIAVTFGHITDPIDAIKNLAVSQQIGLFERKPSSLLKVTAGLLGATSGTAQAKSFDFGVYNNTRRLTFLNNDRFHPVEKFKYASCPYNYYETSLRSEMYDLFGPKPITEPLSCRGPRGKNGTITGTWFDKVEVFDSPYFGQTQFSPVSIATSLNGNIKIIRGLETQVYRVETAATTYANPEDITTEHCYEVSGGGYFYFQLQSNGTLRVA